jgi:predicted metal-dependent hydrolase
VYWYRARGRFASSGDEVEAVAPAKRTKESEKRSVRRKMQKFQEAFEDFADESGFDHSEVFNNLGRRLGTQTSGPSVLDPAVNAV